MALKLMSSGGGSVTLDVPSTASNLALTVPALAGTVVTENSSNRVAIGKGTAAAQATLSIGNGSAGTKVIHMASDGVNDTGGGSVIVMGNSDSGGTNPMIIAASNAELFISRGDSFSSATGGTHTWLFRLDKNGNMTTVRPNATAEGTYPAFMCRAFIRVSQQGTQSIQSSGNISSIVDGGTGLTTVNMSQAMPDSGYTVVGGQSGTGVISGISLEININTSTQFGLRSLGSANATAYDMPMVSVAVYR